MNERVVQRLITDAQSYQSAIQGKKLPRNSHGCYSWQGLDNTLADLLNNIRSLGLQINHTCNIGNLRKKCGCSSCGNMISVNTKNKTRKQGQDEVSQFLDYVSRLDLTHDDSNQRTVIVSYQDTKTRRVGKKNPFLQ